MTEKSEKIFTKYLRIQKIVVPLQSRFEKERDFYAKKDL
jgi:hypothetical protein